MYSDSSQHFGGVNHLAQVREDVFGRRDVVESFKIPPHTQFVIFKRISFILKHFLLYITVKNLFCTALYTVLHYFINF